MSRNEQAIGVSESTGKDAVRSSVESGDFATGPSESRRAEPEETLNPSAPGQTGTTPGTNTPEAEGAGVASRR